MAKTLSTKTSTLKFFGIKIFEYNSDFVWRECTEDMEEIRDDIILHERISENIRRKDNNQ